MDKIEKIRQELDKRYQEYRAKMKTEDFTYYEGMADALDLFEQFLDTLSEEPDKSLEEAALGNYYGGGYIPKNQELREVALKTKEVQSFIAGAEWQASQMPMPEDTVLSQKGVAEGRRLEREDMMRVKVKSDCT